MYHLRTLGGLALEHDGAPLAGAPRKALALMAVLAAGPTIGVSRDRLMLLLWPESDTERARGALKQTIHVLRQLLRSPDALIGNTELRLNSAIVTSDVAGFIESLAEGDAAAAIRHYSGAFLDGVHIDSSPEFQRWAEETRGDLARRRSEAIEQLANAATNARDHVSAARWWQALQASDPLSGRIAVKLMLAFEASGDRAAALRHARVHSELMNQELGAAPDAEVAALAQRLTSAPEARSAPIAAEKAVAEPAPRGGLERAAPASRRRGIGIGIGAAAAALLLLILVLNRSDDAAALGDASLDPKRVAVAVFENETGDSTLGSLGKMASDWVIRGLARTGLLHVLDAATLYAEPRADPEDAFDLARRNGAGVTVAGRFYRQGDSLLFTASIFDVASRRVLNTLEPVGARPNEALPAVEELRQRIAAALVAALDPRATTFLQGDVGQPPRYDAYREFVAAQETYWSGRVDEGVAGFRRAALMDTTFLSARVTLAVTSATLDACETTDSVIRELERRQEQLSPAEIASVRGSQARCNRDWERSAEFMRARAAAEPGSTIAPWAIAANFRRANRPAEAAAILQGMDPSRDLGWMSDPGKVMFWRELAWAQHMLGDSTGQRNTVAALQRMAPGRLATAYFASLAHLTAGQTTEAIRALEGVERLTPDPAIVAGEIAGRNPPPQVGTPAWVLYQIATELVALGDSTGAATLARRASSWLEGRPVAEREFKPSRYMRVLALELEGRLDSALVLVRQLLRDAPRDIEVRGRLGVLSARAGRRSDALEAERWLAQQPPMMPPGAPHLERARIAAALGDRDRAMQLLETLPFHAHPVDVVFFHSDPAFASLRNDARWIRMLKPRG